MKAIKAWIQDHRNPLIGLAATGVMVILLFFLFDWVVMPLYTHHGWEEELPDITELSFEEAEKVLDEKGFDIVKDGEQFDAIYAPGTVISQNPPPFTKVKKGRRIYVIVSAGEKKVRVPRVIGSSEREAAFILRQAGLELGEVYYEYDNYYLKDVVSGQSLTEGLEVVEKTQVDITVSLGRMPSRFVVPQVVGKSLETAKRMIRQAGLTVGEIRRERNDKLIPDTVLHQSIEGGEETEQGTIIDLTVSRLGGDSWEE